MASDQDIQRLISERNRYAPSGQVLVADDDQEWLKLVRTWLEEAGYRVFPLQDGGRVVEMAGRLSLDCIVLDYYLNGMTAADLCAKLQANEATRKIPVIVLTSDDRKEKSSMYDGADHFVVKSPSADELLAKLHASLRRRALDGDTLVKGDLRLDRRGCTVHLDGKLVCALADNQFVFLHLLVKVGPRSVSRGEAALAVWGKKAIASHVIRKFLCRLRARLGHPLAGRIYTLHAEGWAYRPRSSPQESSEQ